MGNKTILVVEDKTMNMVLVVESLKLQGYAVLEAVSAEIGIRMAHTHKPDLILMDIQLPGMDGLTATRLIKGDPATQEIPVVAFTAYAMNKDLEDAREAGCSGVITKPFSLKPFLEKLKELL